MGLKNNENSGRKYFYPLQLSGRSAKLHLFTGTKKRERSNFRGLVQSFAKRSLRPCKTLLYCFFGSQF